jgi:hypothetical protein
MQDGQNGMLAFEMDVEDVFFEILFKRKIPKFQGQLWWQFTELGECQFF